MPMGCLIRHSTQRWEAHYRGKDLTGVRGLQRKLMPDTVGLEQHEPTSLRGLAIGDLLETVMIRAEASTTEEPDAGKLHVRVCAGGAR